MPHDGRKSANDKLLMALACGATVEAAARGAGVSRRTAHRRLKDPEFSRRLRQTRTELTQRTAGMLSGAGGEAVKTLLTLMRDPTPPAVRLGSARAVLELGIKVRESAELEERVADLEERLGGPRRVRLHRGPES
jgi:hypothetical protein